MAKLMQVKDPAMTTALEVVAGGKLYQVGRCTLTAPVVCAFRRKRVFNGDSV